MGDEDNANWTGADGIDSSGGRKKKTTRRRRRPRPKRATDASSADASGDKPESRRNGESRRAASQEGRAKPRVRRRRRRSTRRDIGKGSASPGADAGGSADRDTSERDTSERDVADADAAKPKRRKRRPRPTRTTDEAGERGGKAKRRRRRSSQSDGEREEGRDEKRRSRRGERRAEKRSERRGDRRSRSSRSERERTRSSRSSGRDGRSRDPRAIEIVPHAYGPVDEATEKVLLVNARDAEEVRIALVVNGRLEEIYVENPEERSQAGNVYRGRVQNVERGIGAAFVDLGRGVTGFLHATDMPLLPHDDPEKDAIDRLREGDEVIVQVTRDSIGRKGPALTGRVSLPGRYLVLMPHSDRSGISRRIPHGRERDRMRRLVRKLEMPEGMGVIVRTASETTDLAALQADLGHLISEWERIQRRALEPGPPGVLKGDSDLAERSVRDIMPPDVTRIVADREEMAGQIHRLLRIWYPSEAAAAERVGRADADHATAALHAPLGELDAAATEGQARDGDEARDQVAPEPTPPEPTPPEPAPPEVGAPPSTEDGSTDAEAESASDVDLDVNHDVAAREPEETPAEIPAQQLEEDAGNDAEEAPDEDLAQLRRRAGDMPDVEIHTDATPLFHAYDIELQLEEAYRRSIRLPSGGSIVIDPTEALIAIDVNSGRLTDEADPESTALVTNLEAVEEAARQLRLRDRGGLVVMDFIDMKKRSSRRQVEKVLHEALRKDRARIRVGRMGPFGLVVLSRQRIRQALARKTHEACEVCGGTGLRRHPSSTGLRIVREVQARLARSRGRGGLEIRAPKAVVAWLRKHRTAQLRALRRTCTGPLNLLTDDRLARDGWAMKGLPPIDGAEDEGQD